MKHLINRKKVKDLFLQWSKERRRGQFTRVSPSVYIGLEKYLIQKMEEFLHQHPSKGKTITWK